MSPMGIEEPKVQRSIFEMEVREKKNQAYQNKLNRTGSRGGSKSRKGVRTAFDYMTAKEKRKLNGEVRVSNMFTTILNWTEFQKKDKETQKELLTKWREIYPNNKIMFELSQGREAKINNQSFSDLVKELGVPMKNRGGAGVKRVRKAKDAVAISPEPQIIEVPEVAQPQQIITKGLHLEFNGKYDVDALNKLFTKLQLLIDGDTNKYNISLSLTEITKN